VSGTTYVLLPPSESKEPGGRLVAAPGFFDGALASPRDQVRRALSRALVSATPAEASRILKVRGPLLERALESSRELIEGTAPLLPAWQRYNGVVWSHLGPSTLSDRQRRRILVPSGLYGISSGTDAIADYRLTMKVSLDGIGNLAKFWRASLTRALEEMQGVQFVSLLPKEHVAAIGDSLTLSKQLITVSFLRDDGDGVAGHDAKAVKGTVARRILDDGPDVIDGFEWRGWSGKIRRGQYLVRAPRVPVR